MQNNLAARSRRLGLAGCWTCIGLFILITNVHAQPNTVFPVDRLNRLLIPAFEEVVPSDPAQWEQRKDEIQRTLWTLMGPVPDVAQGPTWSDVTVMSRTARVTGAGTPYTLDEFFFVDGLGLHVRGYLLVPQSALTSGSQVPAVLYNHYHGGYWQLGADELFRDGWSFGHRLVNEGFVVMAIDAPGHGKRLDPAYNNDRDRPTAERVRDYMFQMYGLSLLGVRTYDDMLALQLLAQHPNVKPDRIAAMGMSMGSPRTYFLAAMMGERLRTAVAVATIPRYQDAIVQGRVMANNNLHFFPGQLLQQIDTEAVVAAVAPLPFKLFIGDRDQASPGFETVIRVAQAAYRVLDALEDFDPVVMRGVGHDYPDWAVLDTVAWLRKYLN